MTDAVQIACITGGCIVLASGVPAWFAWQSNKTSKLTHDLVNSRLDVFMDMAKKTFRAQGIAQERTAERKRQKVKVKKK